MIVECPNCGARYKLPDEVALAGRRMKCAECAHRWALPEAVPAATEDAAAREADALAEAQARLTGATSTDPVVERPPVRTPDPEPEPPADAAPEPEARADTQEAPADDAEETESSGRGRLVLAALALMLLAAAGVTGGVATGRLDPGLVPLAGPALARVQPGPSPLVIEASARLTPLPSGAMLLDVSGVVRNTGTVRAGTGLLKATLESPAGVLRRWSIAVPAAGLAPGAEARFQSTLTEVPGAARTLRLVTGSGAG